MTTSLYLTVILKKKDDTVNDTVNPTPFQQRIQPSSKLSFSIRRYSRSDETQLTVASWSRKSNERVRGAWNALVPPSRIRVCSESSDPRSGGGSRRRKQNAIQGGCVAECKQSRRLRRPHCTAFERNDTNERRNEAEHTPPAPRLSLTEASKRWGEKEKGKGEERKVKGGRWRVAGALRTPRPFQTSNYRK